MSVISSRKVSLNQLVERYLAANTTRKKSGAKGAITRHVNDQAADIGATAARSEVLKVLAQFKGLPEWMMQRFTPGSLYEEGDRVMGWWNTSIQVQAEELPLYRSGASYSVTWYGRGNEIWLWQGRGFYAAENLPITFYSDSYKVDFPVERSQIFLEYGYALPCSLQWYWNDEGLVVTRSIISEGWWQAWKWWDTARWWYLEKRPELFADLDWWGQESEPEPELPEDNPFAAVLGIEGREYWESVKWKL